MCLEGGAGRLALALLCALSVLSVAHAYHKRDEMSPAPFTFAARYGRSPERYITPRNDRWLMTTRYGKRSELYPMERAGSPSLRGGDSGGWGERRALYCEYTGVPTLYRCSPARTHAGAAGPVRALYPTDLKEGRGRPGGSRR